MTERMEASAAAPPLDDAQLEAHALDELDDIEELDDIDFTLEEVESRIAPLALAAR